MASVVVFSEIGILEEVVDGKMSEPWPRTVSGCNSLRIAIA